MNFMMDVNPYKQQHKKCMQTACTQHNEAILISKNYHLFFKLILYLVCKNGNSVSYKTYICQLLNYIFTIKIVKKNKLMICAAQIIII